ncbi:MAG: hypothetical protein WAP49_07435 [Mycobacterium sp.]
MAQCSRPVGAVLSSAALVAAAALTLAAHARMPEAVAAPSTTPTTTSSAASSGTASESDEGSWSGYSSDEYGFLDSAARCDDSQVLMSFGRTSRALVAICVDPDGDLEYRGVRLSDETSLTAPAGRTSDGSVVATNNGVTYAVSPEMLLVSEGDTVLYRDSWLEFRQPRFSGEPATSTMPTSTSTSTSAETPTTTVSTTTVTVTPDSNSGD